MLFEPRSGTRVGPCLDAGLFDRVGIGLAAAKGLRQRPAEQGLPRAQADLGLMYLRGDGVPQDDGEGVRWLRLAADQGLPVAQTNLGLLCLRGRGGIGDEREAARWLRP